jgi:hypothetical protein
MAVTVAAKAGMFNAKADDTTIKYLSAFIANPARMISPKGTLQVATAKINRIFLVGCASHKQCDQINSPFFMQGE